MENRTYTNELGLIESDVKAVDVSKDVIYRREDVLSMAKQAVCDDKNKQYGEPENNFERIASLWTVYKGVEITSFDVAMMMTLLKIARASTSKVLPIDSLVDIAGYAACAAEVME